MAKYFFQIASDLYEAGAGEEGPYIAERYFLQVENEFGSRWNHFKSFPSVEVVYDEFGDTHFVDCRKQAVARVEKLLKRAEGSTINFDFWNETYPAYGSVSYLNDDQL